MEEAEELELYEQIPGELVEVAYEGQIVPVPARWVRERVNLPERYKYASLHKDLAGGFKYPAVRQTAIDYVRNFDQVRLRGSWATFAGLSGSGKTWGSAAIANEVIMNWGVGEHLTVEYLAVAWMLQDLYDYRTFGQKEEYNAMRRRIFDCDLLIVDDLLHAGDFPLYKEFLFGLYDYRHQKKKPIVTSLNGILKKGDWSVVEQAFNGPFARRLASNSKGYTFSR